MPVEGVGAGVYTRGDVLRIRLEINASADMTWVAVTEAPNARMVVEQGK